MKPDIETGYAALIRSLEVIGPLSERDRELVRSMPLRLQALQDDDDVVSEGDLPKESCLVIRGWLFRYKTLPNGRRAILSFHLPGDIPDLQSLHLTKMDHSVAALTPSVVGFVPHDALREVHQQSEQLLHLFWRRSLIDAAMFREWLASATQLTGEERMARLFCETFYRMRVIGLAEERGFQFPATQVELGDALGMSSVHVNRVLQKLRRDGLITSVGQQHGIADWARLQELAHYNPDYLHMNPALRE